MRRTEISLFLALLIVAPAGQPAALTPSNAGTLSYQPQLTVIDSTPATVNILVWW